jgi:hypothetical protein
MSEEKEKSDRRKRIILWSIIILLLGTNGVTIWLLLEKKYEVIRVNTVTEKVKVERDEVRADLEALKKDYEALETSDAAMKKDIEEKRHRIDSLLQRAAKHKNDAYLIASLKKETETLREIMKGYVRTIDSLNTLNINLVAEKKTVMKQLGIEKEKQVTLIKEKDELKSTIAKGSILSCFNISAKAVGYRRGGKKEVETSRARKTEKIKVTYSLGENKIAKAGEKTVFIRIMTPDGKEMAKGYDDNYKFVFNQSVGYWAGKQTLNYANTEITGVTYCEGQGEYVPGTYMIEIVCDNVVIGNSTLKLD